MDRDCLDSWYRSACLRKTHTKANNQSCYHKKCYSTYRRHQSRPEDGSTTTVLVGPWSTYRTITAPPTYDTAVFSELFVMGIFICTLIFQDNTRGLEVDPFHTGNFKAAVPLKVIVLINIMDLLQRLTNDWCRSTIHRVISLKVSGEILPSRFLITFFVHTNSEALIDLIVKGGREVKKYEAVNAVEWRTWNTRKIIVRGSLLEHMFRWAFIFRKSN